jgi:hypothetical protein
MSVVLTFAYFSPDNEMYGEEHHLHSCSTVLVADIGQAHGNEEREDEILMCEFNTIVETSLKKIQLLDFLNEPNLGIRLEDGELRDTIRVMIGKVGDICSPSFEDFGFPIDTIDAEMIRDGTEHNL